MLVFLCVWLNCCCSTEFLLLFSLADFVLCVVCVFFVWLLLFCRPLEIFHFFSIFRIKRVWQWHYRLIVYEILKQTFCTKILNSFEEEEFYQQMCKVLKRISSATDSKTNGIYICMVDAKWMLFHVVFRV